MYFKEEVDKRVDIKTASKKTVFVGRVAAYVEERAVQAAAKACLAQAREMVDVLSPKDQNIVNDMAAETAAANLALHKLSEASVKVKGTFVKALDAMEAGVMAKTGAEARAAAATAAQAAEEAVEAGKAAYEAMPDETFAPAAFTIGIQ